MSDNRGVQVKNCGFCKKCHTPFPISYKKTFDGYCVFCAEKRLKSFYGLLISSAVVMWILAIGCVVVSIYFDKILSAVTAGAPIEEILLFLYMLLIAAAINIAPVAALVMFSRKVYIYELSRKANSKVAVFSYWGLIAAYIILLAWSMSNMIIVFIPVSLAVPLITTILVFLAIAHKRKLLKHFRKATKRLEAELDKPETPEVVPETPYVS